MGTSGLAAFTSFANRQGTVSMGWFSALQQGQGVKLAASPEGAVLHADAHVPAED